MRRHLVVLLFLVVSAGCQSDSASSASGGKADRQHDDAAAQAAVTQTMHRYTDALLKKDMATLERVWADDLIFINPRGQVRTKAQRLADVKSGATAFKSIDLADEQVKMCGGIAALHLSRGKLQAQYSGKEGSGEYRISVALCRHNDGEWRIHAIHMTPIMAGQ
jgi:ketosteroid isomerase-like protein